MAYKYENGTWKYVVGDIDESRRTANTPQTKSTTSPPSNQDNKESTDTKDKADKKYKDSEKCILEAECNIMVDPKIVAKQTVRITGVGKKLSGLYYVEKVTHSFSPSGYSQTLSVSREGFGDSIKKGNVPTPSPTPAPKEEKRPEPVKPKESPEYIPINKYGVVTPNIGLNVRDKGDINAKKLGAMTKGTKVFVKGKKGEWYDISWNGKPSTWSHSDYIRLEG